MTARWYCICANNGRSDVAAKHLRQKDFEVLAPHQITLGLRQRLIIRPLFANYIFIRFDIRQRQWRTIYHTRGVYRIISADAENPIPIADSVIDELLARLDEEHNLDERALHGDMVGQQLAFQSGDQEWKGLCVGSTSQNVRILMQILGEQREVLVNRKKVTIIHA